MSDIQEAEDIHVHDIVEIWKDFMDFHRDIDELFTRREGGHVNFERHVRELMASEDAVVLVAKEGELVVGYSIAQVNAYPPIFTRERYGFISDVAVRAGHRRRGLGTSLVESMLEWLKARGLSRIELRVAAKNRVGNQFWKKLGFNDYVQILYLDIER